MRGGLASALALVALLASAAPGAAAPTREVVILTSFPKELFEAYKQGFEQKNPGVKVVMTQQQTNQAVTYLRETRARPDVDLVWASAVDAFQTLKSDGLLDKVVLPKETLARLERFRDKPEVKSWLETEWDTKAKASYSKAQDRADQAARMR
jgi:ABC-type glycerol-3-phosphate transport system substrate-binding protein